jgi:hypothetical protein
MTTVVTRENPRSDPLTVANSTVDVYRGLLEDNLAEMDRLQAKVERLQGYVADAELALEESVARRIDLKAAFVRALDDRDALAAADPVLAAEIAAERAAIRDARIADLEAELARLREKD